MPNLYRALPLPSPETAGPIALLEWYFEVEFLNLFKEGSEVVADPLGNGIALLFTVP